MNERIHVLAEQARQYATTRHPISNIVLACDSYIAEQRFAELIVAECVQAYEMEVDTWKWMNPFQGSIKRLGSKAIKRHFGVEK